MTFISADREAVVVQTGRGMRIFRSTCVKPFVRSQLSIGTDEKKVVGTDLDDETKKHQIECDLETDGMAVEPRKEDTSEPRGQREFPVGRQKKGKK